MKRSVPLALVVPAAVLVFLPLTGCDVSDNAGQPKRVSQTDDKTTNAQEKPALVAGLYRPLADEGLGTAVVPATGLIAGEVEVQPDMSNPLGNDPGVIAAGRRNFGAFNCSGCHAPLGGGGMGPSLSDNTWIYGEAPAQIYLSILHGRPEGMPAWGAMLPQKTIWEIVAYIGTLDEISRPAEHEGFVRHPLPNFAAAAQ